MHNKWQRDFDYSDRLFGSGSESFLRPSKKNCHRWSPGLNWPASLVGSFL